MTIEIRMTGPRAAEDMMSLCQWFRDEPEIRRNALIDVTYKRGSEGTLGPVEDAVQLVVNDGFQLSALVLSYLGWRDARKAGRKEAPAAQEATIECGGITVHLSNADPDLVATVIRELGRECRG